MPRRARATSAATPQLLVNGGFEAGEGERAADWGLWPPIGATPGVSSLRDGAVKHSGQYSGRLRVTADAFTGICTWHHAAVPVTAGQELVLEYWVKAEAVADRYGLDVQLRQGTDKIVGGAGVPALSGSRDWQEVTHRFTVPAGVDHVCVVPLLYGKGTAWFDEVRLYATPEARPAKAAAGPRVDGLATDACWQAATVLGGFALSDGQRPAPPRDHGQGRR